jgi:MFS transporter, ACS family, D-galactonate transporter
MGVNSSTVQGALFWSVVSLSGLGLVTANNLALCRVTLIPRQAVGLLTGIQNVSTGFAGIVGRFSPAGCWKHPAAIKPR